MGAEDLAIDMVNCTVDHVEVGADVGAVGVEHAEPIFRQKSVTGVPSASVECSMSHQRRIKNEYQEDIKTRSVDRYSATSFLPSNKF